MKKIIMIAAACGMAAMFTACGDDSSTSAGGGSKACMFTYSDGTKQCGSSGLFLYTCGEASDNVTSTFVDGCPDGGLKCVDGDGDVTYVYGEDECPFYLAN